MITGCTHSGVTNGSAHTMVLQFNQPFSIEKQCWDDVYLDRLREACEGASGGDLAIVVMQEGVAHLSIVKNSLTIEKARVIANIPRKASTFAARFSQSAADGKQTSHAKVPLSFLIFFV